VGLTPQMPVQDLTEGVGRSSDGRRLPAQAVGELLWVEAAEQIGVALGVDLLGQLGVSAVRDVGVATRADALDDHALGNPHTSAYPSGRRPETPDSPCSKRRLTLGG
jgi:hypothetical protein